jgi:transposase
MPHRRFIFVDETGMNTDLARRYARAPRGERAHGLIPRNTPPNLSLVGAMSKDGVICSMELEGAIDGAAFLVFIEQVLGPRLKKGDFVVLDNLNTHCSPRVEAAIYARGAFLLFLPRYSPDFNPIEKAWSKLKTYLRGVAARTSAALSAALADGLQAITSNDARAWFRHAGYNPA